MKRDLSDLGSLILLNLDVVLRLTEIVESLVLIATFYSLWMLVYKDERAALHCFEEEKGHHPLLDWSELVFDSCFCFSKDFEESTVVSSLCSA